MKEPLGLCAPDRFAAPAYCALQVMYLLGKVDESGLEGIYERFGLPKDQHDKEQSACRVMLEEDIFMHTISPLDPQRIAVGDKVHMVRVWRMFDENEQSIEFGLEHKFADIQYACQRSIELDVVHPGLHSRERRATTEQDLRQHLHAGRIISVVARRSGNPMVAWGLDNDQCNLYWPEFGATTSAPVSWLWAIVIPALTAYSITPLS